MNPINIPQCVRNRTVNNLPPWDVIKWKHFPRYWPFVRRIHRSPVNSPRNGHWRWALIFSLICAWINDWVNNREWWFETSSCLLWRHRNGIINRDQTRWGKEFKNLYQSQVENPRAYGALNNIVETIWNTLFSPVILARRHSTSASACKDVKERRWLWINKKDKQLQAA